MADVFISYSRKNKEFVSQFVDAVTARKREVWIDVDDIPPSAEWWKSIKEGIDEAHTFVPILTPESLESPVCAFEMDYAIREGKRIIPIMRKEADDDTVFVAMAKLRLDGYLAELIGDTDMLRVARDNWRKIASLNWIKMRDEDNFDEGIEKFDTAWKLDIVRVGLETRLRNRARQWGEQNHDPSYLLVGSELREAVSWLILYKDHGVHMIDEIGALIEASKKQEVTIQRELRRSQTRQIISIVGVFIVIVLLALTLSFLDRQRAADRDKDILETYSSVIRNLDGNYVNYQIHAMNELVSRYPSFPDVYLYRGMVYSQLGRSEGAFADYGRAIALDPMYANAYYRRAQEWEKLGDLQHALEEFTKTLELNPRHVSAALLRAGVYLKLHNYDAALDDYVKAILIDPAFGISYEQRGDLYTQLDQPNQAAADYATATALAP